MENIDQNYKLPNGGRATKNSFLWSIILWFIPPLIADYGCFKVVNVYFALVVLAWWALLLTIAFYFYFKLNFVDEISIDEENIVVKKDQNSFNLPINNTKIFQMFGVFFGGSYLKCQGKWYFVPVTPSFIAIADKLSKLPGRRDYHIWVPFGIIVSLMIAFLIFLVWFVMPSIGN